MIDDDCVVVDWSAENITVSSFPHHLEKICEATLYDADEPCAGPYHNCEKTQAHKDNHRCFCGYAWSQEKAEGALKLTPEEYRMGRRLGFFQ